MAQQGMAEYWQYMEVFWMPGVWSSMLLGNCNRGIFKGKLLHFEPSCAQYRSLEDWINLTNRYPRGVYRGYSGYSPRHYTDCEQFMAVDMYLLAPDMYPGTTYHWFILRDVYDPYYWYQARSVWMNGYRDFPAYAGLPPHPRV